MGLINTQGIGMLGMHVSCLLLGDRFDFLGGDCGCLVVLGLVCNAVSPRYFHI